MNFAHVRFWAYFEFHKFRSEKSQLKRTMTKRINFFVYVLNRWTGTRRKGFNWSVLDSVTCCFGSGLLVSLASLHTKNPIALVIKDKIVKVSFESIGIDVIWVDATIQDE